MTNTILLCVGSFFAGCAATLVVILLWACLRVGHEIDEEYYRLASERLEAEKAQVSLFEVAE